jgi:2-keto-3-deoxy-6-phosphogluconate aldolase
MKKVEILNIIRETGVIAIMRAQSSDQLIAAADAIKKGGVKAIEVTMTTPGVPGCYSPTEVLTGWEAGADFIKLFPASVGGPDLVKAILAPLPQVRIIPVGGVNLDTAADFIRKGAAALGVGNSLVNQKLLDAGDMDELTRRAAAFIEQVKKGRGL